MRDKKQIKERIEIYQDQIYRWSNDVEKSSDYSTREMYRAWIRRNLERIQELSWVLELSSDFNNTKNG